MLILAIYKQSGVVYTFVLYYIQNKLAVVCAQMHAYKYVEHQVHKFGYSASGANLVGCFPKKLEMIYKANKDFKFSSVCGRETSEGDKQ